MKATKKTKKINLKNYIVDVPDFPKKGIIFKDWTPLMNNAKAYKELINVLYEQVKNEQIDVIVSAESRGFWIGCPLAIKKGIRFIPARKPKKLPRETIKASFDLEYGKDSIEISKGDIKKTDRVLIVDDIIATGGTINAIAKIVKQCQAKIVGYMFINSIPGTHGINKLKRSKTPVYLAINK